MVNFVPLVLTKPVAVEAAEVVFEELVVAVGLVVVVGGFAIVVSVVGFELALVARNILASQQFD